MFSHYLTVENVNLWSQEKMSPDILVVLYTNHKIIQLHSLD
jgi:hypothetical protein